ncbi:uncharacterized protein LOC143861406 [Tasmannia lanceolata]|uniref:uncharacterized protein LOC143861406 n=1 Tax=Tasmannia lanceolata TaxID=3420 RepID=UPI0040646306
MEDFNDCIDHCSLHDLNSVGESLSWCNNSRTGDFKLRKLDRALVNDGCPASFVKYKSQNISDHSPLVIFLQEELPNGPKPFRFFNVWLEDLSIYESVERAWKEKVSGSPMYRITQKLKLVKEAIKTLNKDIFGRVDVKLPVVRRNLEDLQAQVKANPSNLELRKKADDLKDFFILTARQEEAILRQKARNNWLTRGDTNSQDQFYGTTNDHGGISSNPADIANAFVIYFSSILNSDEHSPEPSAIPEPVKKLSADQAVWLTRPVLRDEVDMVIKQCDGDKNPGPDGFNGQFFKSFWYLIGDEVSIAIFEFFRKGKLLKSINSTFICLIPKTPESTSPDQFRPISLCNFLYKIISKILATRLKVVLIDIISPNQSAFVEGRLIQENLLLTNDLIHNFHKQNGSSSPAMCLKLDIRKAFDNVCHHSLRLFMKKIGFNEVWCLWISQCISDPSFSILINGTPKEFFLSSNGIRQGDPLSPLLFCIVMEMFSIIFNEAMVSNQIRTPFRRRDLQISHLLFADDVILFASVDRITASGITNCLDKFSACSGLSINLLKSEVFFSGGDISLKQSSTQALRIPEGTLPVTYLGLPLIPSRLTSRQCQPLITKITKRIASWNNKHLSRVGRLELIQSVLNSLHLYWTAAFNLPQSSINEIEPICRTFLWSGSDSKKCYHPVAWEVVCQTKEEGGIGIRRLLDLNKASKMKLLWNIVASNKSLWAQWVQKKYFRGRNLWLMKSPCKPSWGFRGIFQARSCLQPFVCYSIGDGSGIDFWKQPWHPGGIIQQQSSIGPFVSNIPANASVKDLFQNGEWYSLIDQPQNRELKEILRSALINSSLEDSAIWMPTPSGKFTLKSAWESIRVKNLKASWHSTIWFSGNIPSSESIDHIFFECGYSKWIWRIILKNLKIKRRILNLHSEEEWIRNSFKGKGQFSTAIRLLFQASIYSIWFERNERAHGKAPQHKQQTLAHILAIVRTKLIELQRNDCVNQNSICCSKFLNLPCYPKQKTAKFCIWVKPSDPWVKINTDSSLLNGRGGLGGVIRNHMGHRLKWFSATVCAKKDPINLLELQAILMGIQLAAKHKFKNVWIESDSSLAVNIINNNAQCPWKAIPVLEHIRRSLQNFHSWKASHIWREGNAVSDILSKLDFSFKVKILTYLPSLLFS